MFGAGEKFASAVIIPAYGKLNALAEERGIKVDSKEKLLENQVINKALVDCVSAVNAQLAAHENIKKVHFRFDDWTTDNGMLSQTLKLKRRNLQKFYEQLIEETYKGA